MGGGASGKGTSQSRSASSSTSTTVTSIDNSVRTSDFGAIAGAVEISLEALDLGRRSVDRSSDLAESVTADTFAFAGDVTADAYGFAGDAIERFADFAETGQRSVIDGVGDAFNNALRSIGDLAMQTSASTDDRVAKVAIYAFSAAAAALILPKVFGK